LADASADAPATGRGVTLGAPRLGWTTLVVLLLAIAASARLDLGAVQFGQGLENLRRLWADAFPPQAGLFPTALTALIETLAMAFLATLFGFILALPCGLAGARTLSPRWLAVPVRVILGGIRTMPSLLWAVLFVILLGFGPLAGVLAMTMYTMGHLAKLQYEGLEGLPPEPFEAIRATGAGPLRLARFVALPEGSNLLLSQALYIFEYNVRASSIVGFVGAGGIGFYISRYLDMLQYDGVVTLLLVVFATVLLIDLVSLQIRARFLTVIPGRRR
jgi:phosphonate transport system permease protein